MCHKYFLRFMPKEQHTVKCVCSCGAPILGTQIVFALPSQNTVSGEKDVPDRFLVLIGVVNISVQTAVYS